MLRPGVYYTFAPTYRAAKAIYWDTLVREHIPPEIVDKKNDSELAVYYRNGSIQRFVGADNPDAHRGINPIDVVFDEYAEQHEEIWTAVIQPILRENGGTATFLFTPKGKNHAWKLLEQAKENPEWFVHVQSVKDTGVFSDEELAEIRRNTPQALFEQEYLCSFLEGAGQVFRNHRDCTYPATERLPEVGDFKLGIDLAKYQDWTVITPFNLNRMLAYPQDRFNQVDWTTQEGRIEAAYRRYGNARITIDSTGVGDPVLDHLRARGVAVDDDDAFKFTGESRERLLRHLAIMFENRRIRIPEDEGLLSELDYFRYELGAGGRVKMAVPEGLHDDRVMSLALAVWGVHEPVTWTPEYFASQDEVVVEDGYY